MYCTAKKKEKKWCMLLSWLDGVDNRTWDWTGFSRNKTEKRLEPCCPLIKALVGGCVVRRRGREKGLCRREGSPGANRDVVQRMVILLARHLHQD